VTDMLVRGIGMSMYRDSARRSICKADLRQPDKFQNKRTEAATTRMRIGMDNVTTCRFTILLYSNICTGTVYNIDQCKDTTVREERVPCIPPVQAIKER
jgi:hypothetical protein